MAEIKLFEGHVESIKELRKQLADLKDAYAALASEETKDTDKMAAQLNEVAKAQDLLNDVMGNTKNAVSEADRALAQSYNTMQIGDKTVNQLRADLKLLTAVLNDTKPGPGWDELNQKVLEVNNALKGMEQSHGDFRRSVGSYAKIFDNFEKGANQVKQAGNDIQGALSAMAGAMNLTKSQQEDLNDSLNQFRSAIQVINGAKGVAGLLKNLKTWLTTTKAKTTAQKADTAQMGIAAAATKTLSTAEKEAATTTTIFGAALNTLPFVAIATAIGLLITHFEDVIGWIQKAMQSIGLFSKEEDKAKTRVDEVNKKLDERNKELERKQKLEKAQGATNKELLKDQKEELQNQIKMIEAEKADIQLRIQKLDAQNAWVKFWNRSNKKIKEETENMAALDEIIKSLKENIKDIDIDIQVEDITAGKAASNAAANALEQHNETLKKAAEAAAGEIKKIYDKTLNPAETVKQTYDEIRKKLDEGEKAELELLKDNESEKTKVVEKYSNARDELAIQEAVETNKAYREMFNKTMSGVKSLQDVMNAFDSEAKAYKKSLRDIFAVDINQYTDEMKELGSVMNYLQQEYEGILETVGKTNEEQMEQLRKLTSKDVIKLYEQMLLDEEKFVQIHTQPFSEAIKLLGENLVKYQETAHNQAVAHIQSMKEEVEKALGKNDGKGISETLARLLSMEGVANDPDVLKGAQQYAKNVKAAYVNAIMESGNPFDMDKYFFKWLNEGLSENAKNAKAVYQEAAENFKKIAEAEQEAADSNQKFQDGIYASFDTAKNKSQEYLDALAKVEEAEQKLQAAREARMISYAQIAEKYMDLYGSTAENMLTNVAKYWETTLKIKDDNLKKDLEQGKISQKEYEAAHKRNEDSFNQMKKLQIAAAVISTAAAIVQALADPTVPNFYLRLANSIAAGLAGAAEIATIRATELGSSGGGSGTSAPQLVDRSPMVQTVGMNPNDYAAAQSQQPIRAYVVDSDLKAGLETLNNRENETTF